MVYWYYGIPAMKIEMKRMLKLVVGYGGVQTFFVIQKNKSGLR